MITRPALLTREQEAARGTIDTKLKAGQRVIKVVGPAGTGKTTLAVDYAKQNDACAMAFTGKAASVLYRKGAPVTSTIHGYLYHPPRERGDGGLSWQLRERRDQTDLIVVDEWSMVDPSIGRDLYETGTQMVIFGDSVQLPPVGGRKPFFDQFPIDVELKKIHRQALNSPVLKLATRIREGGDLPYLHAYDPKELLNYDVVITALRDTRHRVNMDIRRLRTGESGRANPEPGDRVICLRTNHGQRIFNGTIWTVVEAKRDGFLWLLDLYDEYEGHVSAKAPRAGFHATKTWTDRDLPHLPRDQTPFDYAYGITCHRAAGSEWPNVAVIDETDTAGFDWMAGDMPLDEYQWRWLYVAITRASERVRCFRGPSS